MKCNDFVCTYKHIGLLEEGNNLNVPISLFISFNLSIFDYYDIYFPLLALLVCFTHLSILVGPLNYMQTQDEIYK